MDFEIQADGSVEQRGEPEATRVAAYTTLRTHHGCRVLRLEQHVARLVESAQALLGARPLLELARVRQGLATALGLASFAETRVRLTFAPPRLFAELLPFEPLPDALYETGVACVSLALRRSLPRAKDTRFIAAADAARARLPAQVHEGLMTDDADGAILEGLSSNFFAVVRGELRTEDARVLQGVTRGIALELCAARAPLRLAAPTLGELVDTSEAFLTSVSRGVLPVTRLDDRPIGDGRPGALTRALRADFERLVEHEARDVREG